MLENQGIFSMKQGIQSHYYEREQTSKEKEESKTAATFDK